MASLATGGAITVDGLYTVHTFTNTSIIGSEVNTSVSQSGVSSGYVCAQKFTATKSGSVGEIQIYTGAAGTARLAIYSDVAGVPTAILTETATAITVQASKWHSLKVPSINLVQGTDYWIAAQGSAGNVVGLNQDGSTDTWGYQAYSYGAFSAPLTLTPSGASNGSLIMRAMPSTNDLMGNQTSNSSPYVCNQSSQFDGSYFAYQAFDGNEFGSWMANSPGEGATGWISVDFGADNEKIVSSYRLNHYPQIEYDVDAWVLEGSSTGSFSGEEVALDTRINQRQFYNRGGMYYYTSNTTAYRYYRFRVTQGGTSGRWAIRDLRLYEPADYFTPNQSGNVGAIVIGGGGGGDYGVYGQIYGAGGAGGTAEIDASHAVTATPLIVAVGDGGKGGSVTAGHGTNGGSSVFNSVVATGGEGAIQNVYYGGDNADYSGGAGTYGASGYDGGGGAGAGGNGGAHDGGIGVSGYGGGGAAGYYGDSGGTAVNGGGEFCETVKVNADANTGGGGGGGNPNNTILGGDGADGIVVISYLTSSQAGGRTTSPVPMYRRPV